MNSLNRTFGKLTTKGHGQSTEVTTLLADFENADKTLGLLIDTSKLWRDAWTSLLMGQLGIATNFDEMYQPIVPEISDGDYNGPEPASTPRLQSDRTAKLVGAYSDLRMELLEEVNMIDSRLIKPAMDAKEYVQMQRKQIKRRENKRLDWERAMDRLDHATKKDNRTDRESAVLARLEEDLSKAQDDFDVVDELLRTSLPPIINAAFALLPHLMNVQIMIQTSLLAQWYTALHNYCEGVRFPSPPPATDEVVYVWDRDFMPIRRDMESITVIARGKAVHQAFAQSVDNSGPKKSTTGLGIRNKVLRRPGTQSQASATSESLPRVNRVPSSQSISSSVSDVPPPKPPRMSSTTSLGSDTPPRIARTASSQSQMLATDSVPRTRRIGSSQNLSYDNEPPRASRISSANSVPRFSPAASTNGYPSPDVSVSSRQTPHASPRPGGDYFNRSPSNNNLAAGAAAAAKKKPPPPPPKPKRIASNPAPEYVIALYDFTAQGQGDLGFSEGSRIKIIKKTDSTDDWWEGELNGMKGSFPANYCQAA